MVFYNCSCNFRNLEILAQSKESSSMVARYNNISFSRIQHLCPIRKFFIKRPVTILFISLLGQFGVFKNLKPLPKDNFAVLLQKQLHEETDTHEKTFVKLKIGFSWYL